MGQMQKGYVRTLGRPNNPSKPISEVIIRLKGRINAVMSEQDGSFSFHYEANEEGEAAEILSVYKVGYQLVDKTIIGSGFVLSSTVPWVIVMVSNEQLEAEKNRISEITHKKAEEEYKKRLTEINNELNLKTLSVDEYRAKLSKLDSDYESYLFLIGTLADKYARTDYDNIDTLSVQITHCIEEGDYDRADSLIQTRINPDIIVEQNHRAKVEVQDQLEFLKTVLQKAVRDKELLLSDPTVVREP